MIVKHKSHKDETNKIKNTFYFIRFIAPRKWQKPTHCESDEWIAKERMETNRSML